MRDRRKKFRTVNSQESCRTNKKDYCKSRKIDKWRKRCRKRCLNSRIETSLRRRSKRKPKDKNSLGKTEKNSSEQLVPRWIDSKVKFQITLKSLTLKVSIHSKASWKNRGGYLSNQMQNSCRKSKVRMNLRLSLRSSQSRNGM